MTVSHTSTPSRRAAMRASLLALVACTLCAIIGCNIVGPAAYLVEGPPTVDAEYELADRKTLVFVDDRQSVVNPSTLRSTIGNTVAQELMSKKKLSSTINTADAIAMVRRQETADAMLSVQDIGKAVGAEQVIYVEMLAFRDTPDGATPRPEALCRVRVTDVLNAQRLFPASDTTGDYRVVNIRAREVDPDLYSSRSARVKLAETLALETGRQVAQLFYKHERKALGSSLNPR